METFNSFAFNPDDGKILWGSFDKLKHSELAVQILEKEELEIHLKSLLQNLSIPAGGVCSFQNLFRFSISDRQFYIGQILLNYGFQGFGRYGTGTFNRKYYFQAVGFADCKVNFGKTLMRPETTADKLVGRFFGKDISLDNAEKFNEKYYLVSSDTDTISKSFTANLTDTISKYDNLELFINGTSFYITFCDTLKIDQMEIIEDVLCNSAFLK